LKELFRKQKNLNQCLYQLSDEDQDEVVGQKMKVVDVEVDALAKINIIKSS